MTELSIIIVNYFTEEHIINCIKSISDTFFNIDYEIIVVDNGTRNSINFKEQLGKFQKVSYYQLDYNYGFGYACNKGTEKAKGHTYLFLNPDITVTKGAIDNLYEFIMKKEDAGFVTGVLIDEIGELQYFYNNFPRLSWEFKEAFGIGVTGAIKKLNSIDDIANKKCFRIDWAHGACLMIKSEIFKKTRGFDENIFLYYEDVDIQKQCSDLGYNNYCIPYSQFIHYTRSSVRSSEGTRIYYFYLHRGKLYYMKKYFPVWKNLLVRMFYIIGFSSKIILLPFRGKYAGNKFFMVKIYSLVLSVYLNLKTKYK